MLPVACRVRRPHEFRTAMRGVRAGGDTLVVHLALGPSEAPAKAGFIVGRSVGSAVVRNRVRRRLREQTRMRIALLPARALLVVRALPAAATADSTRLGADLHAGVLRALRRTG